MAYLPSNPDTHLQLPLQEFVFCRIEGYVARKGEESLEIY